MKKLNQKKINHITKEGDKRKVDFFSLKLFEFANVLIMHFRLLGFVKLVKGKISFMSF